MEEELEAPIDSVTTLWEEHQELWGREEAIVGDGFEEVDVSVLKDNDRAPGWFRAGVFGKATRRRQDEVESGGSDRAQWKC
jgi:hypothetical protein